MEIIFRPMIKDDWQAVSEIYRQGIATGNATFETDVPSWEKWDSAHIKSCRIVAISEDVIVGWAALVPVSARKVYSGVGEISIYVADKYKELRVGTRLLESLIRESEAEGFWTLQAVIFPENRASLTMHLKLGFRMVGIREKIGKMKNNWRNTILLERRNPKF